MLSRRTFIRNVAIGATGAALSLGRHPSVQGAGKEVGIITLDAIFLVYIPAIPGSVAGGTKSSFSFGKNFSVTFSLSLPGNPDIALKAALAPDQEGEALPGDVSQFQSMAVPGAMLLRTNFNRLINGEVVSVSLGAGPDTRLYGLARPKLRLAGRPGGKMRYSLADAPGVIVGSLSGLQQLGGFSQQTVDSLRALYITDPGQLIPPRFEFVKAVSGGVGTELNETGNVNNPVSANASAIATIIDQTGFESETLIQAFAPGTPMQITYSSAQEFPSKSIAKFTLANNDTTESVKIYQDLALKTWVMIPAG